MSNLTSTYQNKAFAHFLRTGRKTIDRKELPFDKYTLRNGDRLGEMAREALIRAVIKKAVRAKWKKPNDIAVEHYFFENGKIFDIVRKDLLSYLTRSDVFRKAKEGFIEDIKRSIIQDAPTMCNQSIKSVVELKRKFSDYKSINFTKDFFALGDSHIKMEADVSIEIHCLKKVFSVSGKIDFSINDEFIDAIDIWDLISGNQDFPYGTPYKMVASWPDRLYLKGSF